MLKCDSAGTSTMVLSIVIHKLFLASLFSHLLVELPQHRHEADIRRSTRSPQLDKLVRLVEWPSFQVHQVCNHHRDGTRTARFAVHVNFGLRVRTVKLVQLCNGSSQRLFHIFRFHIVPHAKLAVSVKLLSCVRANVRTLERHVQNVLDLQLTQVVARRLNVNLVAT